MLDVDDRKERSKPNSDKSGQGGADRNTATFADVLYGRPLSEALNDLSHGIHVCSFPI